MKNWQDVLSIFLIKKKKRVIHSYNHGDSVITFNFSPNGVNLISSDFEKKISVWNLIENKLQAAINVNEVSRFCQETSFILI